MILAWISAKKRYGLGGFWTVDLDVPVEFAERDPMQDYD